MVAEPKQARAMRRFYEQALTAAENEELGRAQEVGGLDEEIAALRLRLRRVLQDSPKDIALMLRGMDVLRRLVATRYALSRADEDALDSAFVEETRRRLRERREGGGEHDVA